jgi:putative heme transporter
LIAYGVASLAGFFVITPGGAGAYEAIMVAFLAVAGIGSGIAIAGIVLTRVIVLMGTIGLGYVFYQHAILKYGKQRGE